MRSARAGRVTAYACTIGAALATWWAAPSAQGRIAVGPNVQVSRALADDAHFEMQLAADPLHPERLMACSMLFPADYTNTEVVTYVSRDGGRSWWPTLRTRAEASMPSWDPSCAFTADGVAYSLSENVDAGVKSYDRIDRSADGGLTWESPVRTKHAERNFLTVDTTTGQQRGWIYLQGAGYTCAPGARCVDSSGFYLQYSSDAGRTFQSQVVPVAAAAYAIGFGPGVVLSNGTFVAPMGEWKNFFQADGATRAPASVLDHDGRWANTALKVFRAKVDRPNWPLTIDEFPVGDWFMDRGWSKSTMAGLAVDQTQGPFRDRLYIVWPDAGAGRTQILLAYSSDEGRTWSRPRAVSDDRPRIGGGGGPDSLHGEVAVNRDGVVAVSWYDRRDQADNLGWTVRVRASLDGGETFLASVPVSEVPYEPERTDPVPLEAGHAYGKPNEETRLGVHSFNFSGGHTAGLAAGADGRFHALWIGNATGVPQLWTAPVTVSGAVQKNGSPTLSALADVSGKVELRFTNRRLVRSTRMVESDLRLENLSDDTFHAPLKLRVLDLHSDLGVPEIVGADEGGSGEGAVLDFSGLVEGGELKPHTMTQAKPVRIHMTELDPLRPFGPTATVGLAVFNTKILAGHVTGPTKDSPTLKRPTSGGR